MCTEAKKKIEWLNISRVELDLLEMGKSVTKNQASWHQIHCCGELIKILFILTPVVYVIWTHLASSAWQCCGLTNIPRIQRILFEGKIILKWQKLKCRIFDVILWHKHQGGMDTCRNKMSLQGTPTKLSQQSQIALRSPGSVICTCVVHRAMGYKLDRWDSILLGGKKSLLHSI
jgi:hypothetical protein